MKQENIDMETKDFEQDKNFHFRFALNHLGLDGKNFDELEFRVVNDYLDELNNMMCRLMSTQIIENESSRKKIGIAILINTLESLGCKYELVNSF